MTSPQNAADEKTIQPTVELYVGVLDSLVRKSLVAARSVDGSTRYGLLETIRQFAEEQLAGSGTVAEVTPERIRMIVRRSATGCRVRRVIAHDRRRDVSWPAPTRANSVPLVSPP